MKKLFFVLASFLFVTTLPAADMLVRVLDVPKDESGPCPNGGVKIEIVVDLNGNGEIDVDADNQVDLNLDSVADTKFVCNGADGTATTVSVSQGAESCGTKGGITVTVGLDTFAVCNGANGKDAFVRTSPATEEEASANGCLNGGIKVEYGQENTVTGTRYLCNGNDGEKGDDGNNALVKTSDVPKDGNDPCPNGGVKIEVFIDKNNNGKIDDEDEIIEEQTNYVCNGAKGNPGGTGSKGEKGENGKDGADGAPGEQGEKGDAGAKGDPGEQGEAGATGENGRDGASSLVSIVDEPKGGNCTSGGKKVAVGLDSNRNGTLDEDEIDENGIYYICNGSNAEETGLTSSSTGCSLDTVEENGGLIPALFAVFAAICAFFGLKTARR